MIQSERGKERKRERGRERESERKRDREREKEREKKRERERKRERKYSKCVFVEEKRVYTIFLNIKMSFRRTILLYTNTHIHICGCVHNSQIIFRKHMFSAFCYDNICQAAKSITLQKLDGPKKK